MMEMLISQRNFMKYDVIFLHPLMRVKSWENGFHGYIKQSKAKDMHRPVNEAISQG